MSPQVISARSLACVYCGLPIRGIWRNSNQVNSHPSQYCCSGCRLADAIQHESTEDGPGQRTLIRIGLAMFCTMNVMMFSMVLWSRDVYPVEAGQAASAWHGLLRHATLLGALPVLYLLGGPLVYSAWDGIRRGCVVMDQLLMLGVGVAFGYSLASLWRGDPHLYFEVGCVILVAVTIGRWLEATCRHRATRAIEGLRKLLPDFARRLHTEGEKRVRIEELRPDDQVRVLPGERLPSDGMLSSAHALLDEQLITGESLPVEKTSGTEVHGGSLNLAHEITLRVTVSPDQSLVCRMADLVRQAALERSPQHALADQLTSWFVPAVFLIAGATFAYHFANRSFGEAWMITMSVILIACPCALAIATPLAVWCALSHATRRGIIVRNGEALEKLATVKNVFFDKTGTLTTGDLRLADTSLAETANVDCVNEIAAKLAAGSLHPLAQSLSAHLASSQPSGPREWTQVREMPGRGVWASHSRWGKCALGSLRFLREEGFSIPDSIASEIDAPQHGPQAFIGLGYADRVQAIFWWDESIRPQVQETFRELRQLGLRLALLSGDRKQRVVAFQQVLPVDVQGELLPTEKLGVIRAAKARGNRVAMVGDGINDAPSLAEADVGIAMGAGAEVSRSAAAICLLRNDLSQLPWLVNHARRMRNTIQRNMVWALGYNIVGIGFAAVGWLNPIFAAVAMVGSSLLVIAESIRLAPPVDISDVEFEASAARTASSRESPHRLANRSPA